MESMTLSDLATIVGMAVGPVLLFTGALMRYMHVDNTKTRDLIEQSNKENRDLIKANRDLIEQSNKENRDLIKANRDLIEQSNKENRDLIERVRVENREDGIKTRELIEKTRDQVADARERLARIEGHLGTQPPPEDETRPGDARAA